MEVFSCFSPPPYALGHFAVSNRKILYGAFGELLVCCVQNAPRLYWHLLLPCVSPANRKSREEIVRKLTAHFLSARQNSSTAVSAVSSLSFVYRNLLQPDLHFGRLSSVIVASSETNIVPGFKNNWLGIFPKAQDHFSSENSQKQAHGLTNSSFAYFLSECSIGVVLYCSVASEGALQWFSPNLWLNILCQRDPCMCRWEGSTKIWR